MPQQRKTGARAPQQRRKLVIVTNDRATHESKVVALSDSAGREFKKAIAKAKAHGGPIVSVDLKP